MFLDFRSVPIPHLSVDPLGFSRISELSIYSFCIHSIVILNRIVNLFILYPIVCDTEAIVAEKFFHKSLGLLDGIGLSSVCKYTHIPHQGSHNNIAL